ncbi:MAG: gamma-glutamyltransferase, partial [Salinivenus sp.]
VAERIVEDLRGKGNAMTERDLARYWAAERAPMTGTYRGHTIYGSAPATTGGATLVSKLQLLDRQEASTGAYATDADRLHAMIEAWKLTPETSGRIADPGLWPVRRAAFEHPDTARTRWQCFDPQRAITSVVDDEAASGAPAPCAPGLRVRRSPAPSSPTGARRQGRSAWTATADRSSAVAPHVPRLDGSREGKGTTGFTVADGDGNMVAVTQTLGTWGGSFYMTPGLGFLYNDKLGSYRSSPDAYNARLPFARNSTSISPTLVFEGTGAAQTPLLATGAGGNAWITSAVYQIVEGVVHHGLGPQRALEQPRFLVGETPDGDGPDSFLVQYEDGLAPSVVEGLRDRGHRLQPISLRGELRMGFAAAVKILGNGAVAAGGDPRRAGRGGAIE